MEKILNVYVDDAVFTAQFACITTACKSACCRTGDAGAPLTAPEAAQLITTTPKITHHLTPEAQGFLTQRPPIEDHPLSPVLHTACTPNGDCIYFQSGKSRTGSCSLQELNEAGIINHPKPISCSLFPLRIHNFESGIAQHLTYIQHKMCCSARHHGQERKQYLLEYLQEPLSRALGSEFVKLAKLKARCFRENT